MPGLSPGIHDFRRRPPPIHVLDGRAKPGHDDLTT